MRNIRKEWSGAGGLCIGHAKHKESKGGSFELRRRAAGRAVDRLVKRANGSLPLKDLVELAQNGGAAPSRNV